MLISGIDYIPRIRQQRKQAAEPKDRKAKIANMSYQAIIFSDGSEITYDHPHDCCERNYADFEQLESEAFQYAFDLHAMEFESTEYGFCFRSIGTPWFFVPCYSEQNGNYTNKVDIYLRLGVMAEPKKVLGTEGKIHLRRD